MTKLEKGSDLAKEHMAKIRAMRKKKELTQNETQSILDNVEPVETNQTDGEIPKRRGRLIKGSPEAKAFMANIRAKKYTKLN